MSAAIRDLRLSTVNIRLVIGGAFLASLAIIALLAPLLAKYDPLDQDLLSQNLPPFWMDGYDASHFLGTDSLGRDVLSRLIWGARPAMFVMVFGASISAVIGISVGLGAGYLGGRVDAIASRIIDVFMSFPPMLLAIILVAVIGAGLNAVIMAIILIGWTRFARVIRAEVIVLREQDFILAARLLGFSRARILLHELLPNIAPVALSLLALEMGRAIIVEGVLAFIGFSSSGMATWGGAIADGRLYVYQAWWVMAFPIFCIMAAVLALGLFSDGLRQALDPVLR